MTLRPFFVDMRLRNPWVRFRETLLGWNVRFMLPSVGQTEKIVHFSRAQPSVNRYPYHIREKGAARAASPRPSSSSERVQASHLSCAGLAPKSGLHFARRMQLQTKVPAR